MRFMDWLAAGILVFMGLSCLTVSGVSLLDGNSISSYIKMFLQICSFMGIPVFIAGLIYFILRKKGTSKK
ncbi:hypothetical protein [Bacillus taeanensis]|uniref:Uncharacterized protein n=1 Tax=Bacillus taeanensis TaxID=273032 RepID=A0A366XP33_9BACI|nr:hypothetical protein [Bacillus taeanensis]RBW67496.1 hypothetical protein DS031_22085 [Bacillus taeanensis]